MRKRLRTPAAILAAALAVAFIAAPGGAFAQSTGVSFNASVGTDGIGGDALFKTSPFVFVRGGFRYNGFNLSHEFDGVDYNLDLGLTSAVGAVDVHPFLNGFQISGGAYFGGRKIGLDAMPAVNVEIGNQVFTPQEVGVLTGDVDLNNTAPFLGVGFNNGVYALKRVGFQAMLGAMYVGKPDIALSASGGTLSNDPIFLDELANEEQRLRDDFNGYRFYPILSLGLTVRF